MSYTRGKRITNPNTSILVLENVKDAQEASYAMTPPQLSKEHLC